MILMASKGKVCPNLGKSKTTTLNLQFTVYFTFIWPDFSVDEDETFVSLSSQLT